MSANRSSAKLERRVNSMKRLVNKVLNKALRKARVRSVVKGSDARPRLSVFISNTHVSAQIINDETAKTIVSSTTVGGKVTGSKSEKAAWVGTDIAKKAKKAKVTSVVFDRNGRQYAGRLKAIADAARKEGLEF
jgi:large subunit ribosomal protein L18